MANAMATLVRFVVLGPPLKIFLMTLWLAVLFRAAILRKWHQSLLPLIAIFLAWCILHLRTF